MNLLELVKHYFPDVTNEMADHILWTHTGFPMFWHLTNEYPTPMARCRKQLRELKYKIKRGKLK